MVYKKEHLVNIKQVNIDISNKQKGMYFVKIAFENKVMIKKFIYNWLFLEYVKSE